MIKIETRLHHKHKQRTSVNGIDGLTSKEVAEYMYKVASRLGPGHYIELGCLYGATALCIAAGIRDHNVDAHLTTVDMFDGYTLKSAYKGTFSEESVRATFEENGVSEYITTIKGLTADAAIRFQDKELNFVFIDADHSYSGCKADFDAWSPMVRSGGEIAFHDNNLRGPFRVLQEISWEKREIDNLTIVTKP